MTVRKLILSVAVFCAAAMLYFGLTVSAAAAGQLAVGEVTLDTTTDNPDLFGDGTASYTYNSETNMGTLTLVGYDDSHLEEAYLNDPNPQRIPFPSLDVWAGEGQTQKAFFSVVAVGNTPITVIVRGKTTLSKGISLEHGMVYFEDADVRFGSYISCGAVVHDGYVTVRNTTMTLGGVESMCPTRPDSAVTAFLYGYDILLDGATVNCDVRMEDNIYLQSFLYAYRHLLVNDSRITLKTDKIAFLYGFLSGTGYMQFVDSTLDIARPQWCFTATAQEEIDASEEEANGSVSFRNTRVRVEQCGTFAVCYGFACIDDSDIEAKTLYGGLLSYGDVSTYVILRDSKLSLAKTGSNSADGTYGLLLQGGALVMADGTYRFDGYGCGVCAYGDSQFSLEKKVRLKINAQTCALFLASQVETPFNPTVKYRAGGKTLTVTEIPGSVPVAGVGSDAYTFTQRDTAFAFVSDDPSSADDIWKVIDACKGKTVCTDLVLRTEGAYLGAGWIVLLSLEGVAAAAVGGWLLYRRRRGKKDGEKTDAPAQK